MAAGRTGGFIKDQEIVEEEKTSQRSKPNHSRFTTTEIQPSG